METRDPRFASPSPLSEGVTQAAAENTVSGEHAISSALLLKVGAILGGRYEILQMLGEGGMGVVYKARDRELDRLVALKLIRPAMAASPEALQRFKHELVLAREITHRNITRIYDLGEADGLRFITMEYIEGEDLRAILRGRGKFSVEEAVSVSQQICAGLQAAHAEGIVHRDLKPGNIMRDVKGRIVIMDFGLARSSQEDGLTQTGVLVGTVEYMSPEQAKGEPLDGRSDLFSVGLIFYELLTGKQPYKADSAVASLLKRTQERAAPASEVDHSVPRRLSEIVSRCLERDPGQRYQSAQEIIEDLEVWEGKRSAVRPAIVGRKLLPWAIGLALVLLLAGGSWYAIKGRFQRESGHAPVTLLVADFANETSDGVFDGTLEPTFSLALEGASFINSYDRAQARKIITQLQPEKSRLDEGAARLVSLREGISVIVVGSISRQGDGFKVTSKAIDAASGRTILTAEAEASEKDAVLKVVGSLAARIRSALGDRTSESAQLAAAETFSSGSLEAAHAYAQAQELQRAGKWEEAVPQYERAVQLDPNLGRAFAGLAAVHANMGRREEAEKYYGMAMSHLDRMTEREKYRTRGGYYLVHREPRKAIEEYNALVKQFPADSVGLSNLAFAYFELRDMPRAVEVGRRAVETFPNVLIKRTNLALYAVYAGDFDTAAKEAEEVLRRNPAYVNALGAIGMAQAGQGQMGEASASYGKLALVSRRGASMAAIGLADLALYQGKASDAIPILEKGIAEDLADKRNAAAATKLLALADAQLLLANHRQALAATDRAVDLDKQESTLFLAGRSYLEAGQANKALTLASQLQARIETEPQMYGKLLEGEVWLQRGNAKRAVVLFQEAQSLTDTWLGRFDLGRAYLDAGLFTEAYTEFETCLKRRGEAAAVFLDDVPSFRLLPPVHYYLGRAQEGLKSPAALESYKTFLSLYSQATGSKLVGDARRRVNAGVAN